MMLVEHLEERNAPGRRLVAIAQYRKERWVSERCTEMVRLLGMAYRRDNVTLIRDIASEAERMFPDTEGGREG